MIHDARVSRRRRRTPILDLFTRAFPHAPRSVEHFRWKYRENPFGNERISLTFDESAQLVGHYAGYRGAVSDANGRELLANQIGDTMTDVPSATSAAARPASSAAPRCNFYEHFCEGKRRVQLRVQRREHSEVLAAVPAQRPRGAGDVSRPRRRNPPPIPRRGTLAARISARTGERRGPELDELFERVAAAYRFLVRRDARYVRWRYLECPDVPILVVAIRKWRRLAGWIVFRIRGGRFTGAMRCSIRDFPMRSKSRCVMSFRRMPSTRSKDGSRRGREWFDETLRELGFETRAEPQDLSVMCVPFAWPDASRAHASRSLLHVGRQ